MGTAQGVTHTEHPVDQVELQLLDAGHLAQLVLDQGLLGRAVHSLDAEAAELRIAASLLGQLHQGWRSGSRATAAVRVGVVARGFAAMLMVVSMGVVVQ